MLKWGDKYMYNWVGWMESLVAIHKRTNNWTIAGPNLLTLLFVFVINNYLIAPVLFFTVGLMAIPQTIEWLMANLMTWVNKETDRDALDSIKGLPVIMVTLFILTPYTVTWGLPELIREMKQRRVERRLEEYATTLRQVEESLSRWEHVDNGLTQAREDLERQLRMAREIQDAIDRRKKGEDFRPRKIIKLHQFVDTPKIRIFTRDEQYREGNTSTARVARRNRRYNNRDNE